MDIVDKNILILGDFIIDHYILAETVGVENTNPSLVLNKYDDAIYLGGAANVAFHLNNLGVKNIHFYYKINESENINRIIADYPNINFHPIIDKSFPNLSIKHRFVDIESGKQLLRLDEEITDKFHSKSNDSVKLDLSNIDLIMVSDYNKSTIDQNLMRQVIDSGIPHIIDGKAENEQYFKWANMIFPNVKEYDSFCKTTTLIDHISIIVNKRGKEGIFVDSFDINNDSKHIRKHFPVPDVFNKTITNACGCGDIVFAVFGALLPKDFDTLTRKELDNISEIATYCASYSAYRSGMGEIRPLINKAVIDLAINQVDSYDQIISIN